MSDLQNQGRRDNPPVLPPALHERALESIAVLLLGLLCLTITVSVITRWLWRSVVPDEVQWVQLMMIAIILAPLAATMALRMTIEVEVFTAWAGPRFARALAALGHVTGMIFLGLLAWAGLRLLVRSWSSGEYFKGVIDIPNWIGHSAFLVFLLAAFARLCLLFVVDIRGALRKA